MSVNFFVVERVYFFLFFEIFRFFGLTGEWRFVEVIERSLTRISQTLLTSLSVS